MFRLIKAILIGLLTGILNVSNHTKGVLLSNQKCMIQPTLINLHSNEYNQEFHYYQFAAKLDRCVRCCNNLNDLSNKLFVPNKIENLNLSVFNMIIGINKKKTTKHTSCKCKCRFEGRKCNSVNGGKTINVDVSVKNVMYVKKVIIGILLYYG